MRGHNPNTRAIVSSLRSDLLPLRAAAITLIDEALAGADNKVLQLQVKFATSKQTAYVLLRERERHTKSGRRKRLGKGGER